jgi:hypothetical protein
MHRIDTSTAQEDKFGPGKNGFTNGDPATGRRATDLNSDMWDAVQEEICGVIESANIELDKAKHNQLYLAIKKIISGDIPDALIRSKNLSDIPSKSVALSNIGGVPNSRKINGKSLAKDITLDLWGDFGLAMSWAANGALSIYNPGGSSGYGIRFYGSGDLALFKGMKDFWDTGTESAVFYQNGDIKGDKWGGALSSYLGAAARMSYSTADYSSLAGGATEVASTKQLVGLRDRTTPVNRGGTGATTVAAARTNLSVYSRSETDNKYQLKNTASKSQNGQHTDTSTGIITQWGTFTAGNSISGSVTFPKTFPNNVLVVYFFDVITTNTNTSSSTNIQWCTEGTTKSKAVWCSNSVSVGYASFLAIGY